MAAKVKALDAKSADNKRAYERRKIRERNKRLGFMSCEIRAKLDTKTPESLKGMRITRLPKMESIKQTLPGESYTPLRDYYDTPETLAEVKAIMEKYKKPVIVSTES